VAPQGALKANLWQLEDNGASNYHDNIGRPFDINGVEKISGFERKSHFVSSI
jgi:hypothetical protein